MAVDTTVQVTLPQMGESVTEGTVLEWHKQEGDRVEADETLVEISTRTSSASTCSPSCLCHSRTVPSVTDSPICGRVTCTVVLTAMSLNTDSSARITREFVA